MFRLPSWPMLCLLLLSGAASATETLVLCLEKSDVRPWRTQDGGGLNIELLNRVAQRLDLRFEYRGMPWKRCLLDLKANAVSGAIGASFKPDRLEFGVYPGGDKLDAGKRLNNDRYVLLRRLNSRVNWDGHTFSGLEGAVGIQLGYSVGDQLRALGVTVDEGAQKALELARKLAAGRLAAAAMLEGEANTVLDQHPELAAQVEILATPLVDKPYFLMFSHAIAETRADLARRVWNEVEAVRNSREYRKLEREAMSTSH